MPSFIPYFILLLTIIYLIISTTALKYNNNTTIPKNIKIAAKLNPYIKDTIT
jgi:hypothetical protein